jgi:hypothetical protein
MFMEVAGCAIMEMAVALLTPLPMIGLLLVVVVVVE